MPPDADHPQVQEMLDRLQEHLKAHPDGIKEFDLYQRLKAEEVYPFTDADLGDPEQLFKIHFLLFHHLYLLRDRLHHQGRGHLEIHCLKILLTLKQTDNRTPLPHEPLRAYYLDTSKLETTTRADVEQMLRSFWDRLNRFEGRGPALALFDLPEDACDATIKQRYHQLAKEHHPDTGGDALRFREIAEAAEILLKR
uniref:Putative heat shock protein DnaJ domain protein n=1 Tax=Magnetococcus massalia (strain MO-1) TaxID=451514 RepID=A0A1S7LPL0_MAGMO|nr:Putative heat shock protein DnaJ domain protein [Candidatus Magnetococcus massalia]